MNLTTIAEVFFKNCFCQIKQNLILRKFLRLKILSKLDRL